LDAAQLKRIRQFSECQPHGSFRRACPPCVPRGHSRLFCAMQQSIGAMRQLSVIIMVYQRISACNERL